MPATPSIVTAKNSAEKIPNVIGFNGSAAKALIVSGNPRARAPVREAFSRAAIADCGGSASPILRSPTAGKSARKPSATNSVCCALRGKSAETSPADLIINTTSLGMTGAQEHETPYPSAFQGSGIAYDLIYTPFQTRFLLDAAAAGWETVSGLDMFIGQGTRSFTCGRDTIFQEKP